MARLTRSQKAWLVRKFGPRALLASGGREESRPGSLCLPKLFKVLMGKTASQTAVCPESEAEVSELARWAEAGKIPLFPRGRGSSWSGASLPADWGCIIDFSRMRRILSIDADAQAATVEPGASWEDMERVLSSKGLALPLVPSRGLLSTAGGSTAQGSFGEGAWEYGGVADTVIRVRLALPGGSVREISGRDLEFVCGAEGTTGLITGITFRVRKLETMERAAVAFPGAKFLEEFFCSCLSRRLPLWSAGFMNPAGPELPEAAGEPPGGFNPDAQSAFLIPGNLTHAAILAFRSKDSPDVLDVLKHLAAENVGTLLDEFSTGMLRVPPPPRDLHELGLAAVPVSVAVPVDQLGNALSALEKQINRLVIHQGVVVRTGRGGRPEAAIFGYVPADPRRFSYHFAFGLALSAVKIAEKYGGRALESGFLFAHRINSILGRERVSRMRDFKWEVDPGDILNPGKIFEESLVGRGISQLGPLEIPVRRLGNRAVEKAAGRARGNPSAINAS